VHVPIPNDRRLRMIADGLIANPADQRDLAAWARVTGQNPGSCFRPSELPSCG
jgi:hypothetical protein